MPVPRRALAVGFALILFAMPLAGCLKKPTDEVDAAAEDIGANETGNENATLPTGEEFLAAKETTKTTNGSGGIIHQHDYWKGKEQVIVFDDDILLSAVPVFERDDNSKVFIAFINLEMLPGSTTDEPALIFEGTGKVLFEITTTPPWVSEYELSFRSAGADWTPYAPIPLGQPFEYEPTKQETDMPHSFRSLWNWKLQAAGGAPIAGKPVILDSSEPDPVPIHVKITVVKSRTVDDWPGHPAFYDGVTERIVIDAKQGRSDVQHAADVLIYGIEPDQVVPDKLISSGTEALDVYVNITSLTLPPGIENSGFQLFLRTAATRPDDLGENLHHNESDGKTFAYWHVPVNHTTYDSPYQPTSRFSFKVLATPADDQVVYCYRCVPYTMEYTITVIARPGEAAVTELVG